KGSVYRQFRSKEELYAEAVIDGFIELRGKIEKALGEARSERERVTTVVTEILSFFWDRGEFFVLLRDPTRLPPAQSTRFRKERLRLSAVVGRVLAGESAAGRLRGDLDFELATEALFGMIRGVRRNRHPSTTLSEASATVVAIFLDGFQRNAACSRRPTTRTAH
ncbi:MAG TPA: TetR/AcrR family transcriptional regulator, partial [Candidatus Binataceae bacterium]|nr:TetR/AcrR family transcriptional regulator [Candidatus Binataceae bacterium]